MDPRINAAVNLFRAVFLNGIPLMVRQNETAFLAAMCTMAGTDALSGYRYEDRDVKNDGDRFTKFVNQYYPAKYGPHAQNLWIFRCRTLHNFSPALFTVAFDAADSHLRASSLGDPVLDAATLLADMAQAAGRYFAELESSLELQQKMLARLTSLNRGGAIFAPGV